jgi:hypothetical protein
LHLYRGENRFHLSGSIACSRNCFEPHLQFAGTRIHIEATDRARKILETLHDIIDGLQCAAAQMSGQIVFGSESLMIRASTIQHSDLMLRFFKTASTFSETPKARRTEGRCLGGVGLVGIVSRRTPVGRQAPILVHEKDNGLRHRAVNPIGKDVNAFGERSFELPARSLAR